MPCTKGMRACHARCLHRQLVLEYRDARDAYDAELEDATSLYATEVADYKRDHPGPTFKAWLQGQGRPPQLELVEGEGGQLDDDATELTA